MNKIEEIRHGVGDCGGGALVVVCRWWCGGGGVSVVVRRRWCVASMVNGDVKEEGRESE